MAAAATAAEATAAEAAKAPVAPEVERPLWAGWLVGPGREELGSCLIHTCVSFFCEVWLLGGRF